MKWKIVNIQTSARADKESETRTSTKAILYFQIPLKEKKTSISKVVTGIHTFSPKYVNCVQ